MGFSKGAKGRVVVKRMSLACWHEEGEKGGSSPSSLSQPLFCTGPSAEGTSGGLTIHETVCGQSRVKVLNNFAARSILFTHAARPLIPCFFSCDILLILSLIFMNILICSIFRMVYIYSTLFGPSSPSWTLREEVAHPARPSSLNYREGSRPSGISLARSLQ